MIITNSFDIQVLGKLDEKGPNAEGKYFLVLKVGEDKEIESGDALPREPGPGWKEERPFQFDVGSEINVEIFRRSRLGSRFPFTNHSVAKYTGQGIDLLANDVDPELFIESADKKAPRISIKLDLVVEGHTEFMQTVDEDMLRLAKVNGADGAEIATSIGGQLGTVLQKIVPIIDTFAGSHPVLNAAWIVLSSAYKVVQSQIALDDAVRELVEILREMAGQAAVCQHVGKLVGAINIIAEIGRTSLHVAWLIHRYADPSIMGKPSMLARAVKHSLSKVPSDVEECSKRCTNLIVTLQNRVQLDTNARVRGIQDAQKEENIQKWMCAPGSSRNYNAARSKREEKTGSWFIGGSEFEKWKETPGSVLWLDGDAGCGKTILCAASIENVITSCASKPLVGYAYFFFDGTSAETQKSTSYENLIKSIIVQLADRCNGIPAALDEMYGVCDAGHSQPDLRLLEKTLIDIVDCFDAAYIVIDSLDECTERKTLLKWIQSITSSRTADKLHTMATSRPEREIEKVVVSLSSMQRVHIAGYPEAKKDIGRFIVALLSQAREEKNWSEELEKRIGDALMDGADGMFRWVALVFDELLKTESEVEVDEQLKSLPQGLNEIYSRILKRRPDDIKRFLQWIAYSQRAMTVQDIIEVTSINFGQGDSAVPVYEGKRRYSDPTAVLRICSGLVNEIGGRLKLAHFSVKEYLVSLETTDVSSTVESQRRASECTAHSIIAQTCLAYLQHFDKTDSITAADIDPLSLAEYAAGYWVDHFHSARTDTKNYAVLQKLALNLFKPQAATSCALINWIRILNDQVDLEGEFPSPFYCACSFGLTETARSIINPGADMNADAGYATGLAAASRNGHLETVKLLMENGPHSDTERGKMYGVALGAASSQGHLEIVELLVDNDAHLDTEGEETESRWRGGAMCHGTALVLASFYGHLDIVKTLVEHGALLDTEGGTTTKEEDGSEAQHGTALVLASLSGQLDIVKILIEKGADINTKGEKTKKDKDGSEAQHGTALMLASLSDQLNIVKILVEKGADLNTKGEMTVNKDESFVHWHGTVLVLASMIGRLDIVKILVENGADLTTKGEVTMKFELEDKSGGGHGTALMLASLFGEPDIVKILVEKGADLNTKGDFTIKNEYESEARHGTALVLASLWGKLDIVKILVEKGADLNTKAEVTAKGEDESIAQHGTALVLASLRGNLDIVKILVEKGALLDTEGEETLGENMWRGTALEAASAKGHLEIAELLAKVASDRAALQAAEGGEALAEIPAETGEVDDEHEETPEVGGDGDGSSISTNADLAVATLSLDTYHHFLIIILLVSPILLTYWMYLY